MANLGSPPEPTRSFEGLGSVTEARFSPDSRRFALGGIRKVLLGRLDALDENPIESQAELSIAHLAFSQDGRWLALAGSDGGVRLWDLNLADPAVAAVDLPGHPDGISALAFEPSGRWLFTAGNFGIVRRWRLRRDGLLDLACRTAGRNLTQEEWRQYLPGDPYRKTCPDFP